MLSQEGYIAKVLELLNMDKGHSTATPGMPGKYYDANSGTASIANSHSYLHIIGSMMYGMTQTRPDYAFQISHLASFAKNPSDEHFSGMKHLIRYLRGTADYRIIYGSIKDADLIGYSNTNFGACKVTR